jgi:hypothetical protein
MSLKKFINSIFIAIIRKTKEKNSYFFPFQEQLLHVLHSLPIQRLKLDVFVVCSKKR